MKKRISLLSVFVLGVCAMQANARTFPLGTLPNGITPIADGHKSGSFADTFNFKLGGTLSGLAASFTSVSNISAFDAFLQEHTAGGWTQLGTAFSTSETFSGLTSGKYRLEVVGFVPSTSGFYSGNLAVAAVPEADTWLMFLIGSGLVAYQLRRKQKSIPRQPFAAG